MKVRPLILDKPAAENIFACVEYAHRNKVNVHQIFNIMGGRMPPLGDDPKRVVIVPVGYRCAFSIEEQPEGWCRHISISVIDKDPKCMPNEMAVATLLTAFAFRKQPAPNISPKPSKIQTKELHEILMTPKTTLYVEDLDDGHKAVNLVQTLE